MHVDYLLHEVTWKFIDLLHVFATLHLKHISSVSAEVKSSKECLLKVLSAVGGVEDSTSSVSDPCMVSLSIQASWFIAALLSPDSSS